MGRHMCSGELLPQPRLSRSGFANRQVCVPSWAVAQRGYTFLSLLLVLLLLGLGTQRVFVNVAQQHLSIQKRLQMRLVQTYNQALLAYREASPGTIKQFPLELQDLLLDKRQLQTRRYLRKLYADPLQPKVDPSMAWGLTRDGQGRITSVYSLSVHATSDSGETP